jgi:hypothetical protein
MSALPLEADVDELICHVGFGPTSGHQRCGCPLVPKAVTSEMAAKDMAPMPRNCVPMCCFEQTGGVSLRRPMAISYMCGGYEPP